MRTIRLNNGVEIPALGFGVFQIPDLEECKQVVSDAIVAGYRLIDTASIYKNEEAVGEAIRESGLLRSDLFIASKVWIHDTGYERTKHAFADTLEKLGTDYLDLYLIHMPFGDYYGSWRAMEELYEAGKIRAIGVCNFNADRLIDLCMNVKIVPAINQIETHPFCQQTQILETLKEYDIRMQAWGPFAEGRNGIFGNERLTAIGRKYGKTAAQVILRWHIQRGVIAIPKSVHKERIEENFAIWDFSLTEEDMTAIAGMDMCRGMILDVLDPSEIHRVYAIR
ncbi:aldo/keto reductase [uncultured Parabacteroides sp.]|uniref:aldo/keto reductase n=1 Tax=uncultured Parabacteroides sp. TaxID=512312 RepID=UPI00263175E0|nr:aldo/keto reductase [uncultured Parabacteroides sp.]